MKWLPQRADVSLDFELGSGEASRPAAATRPSPHRPMQLTLAESPVSPARSPEVAQEPSQEPEIEQPSETASERSGSVADRIADSRSIGSNRDTPAQQHAERVPSLYK